MLFCFSFEAYSNKELLQSTEKSVLLPMSSLNHVNIAFPTKYETSYATSFVHKNFNQTP